MTNDLIDILIDVNKAVKTLKFYPSGHPNLQNIVSQCFELLTNTLKNGDLHLKVDQKQFYFEDKPLPTKSDAVASLARECFLRKIKQITFFSTLNPKDVQSLLELLCIDPQEIADKGGSEKVLFKKGSRGVQLNEVDFDELLKNQEEEEEEEVIEDEEETSEEEAAEETEQIPGLAELLNTLDNTQEDIVYTDALIRIRECVDPFKSTENFSPILPAMITLAKHTLTQFKLHEALKMKAMTLLKDLLSEAHVIHLVRAHEGEPRQNQQAIEYILFQTKDTSIPLIIEALVQSEEQNKRRDIYKILLNFKETIRPYIEKRLRDEQWFVVRQMVTLLGDLGGERSLAWLEKTYNDNSDERIKKEVLKNLSKIPSPQTTKLLIRATNEEDKSLSGQAIVSLAMMKEIKAIDALGALATKSDLLLDHIDTTKEAVKALGVIGTDQAVKYLSKIALKSKWIGKETFADLKLLAVQSLDKIGSEEARQVIEKVAKKAEGALLNTCQKIIERPIGAAVPIPTDGPTGDAPAAPSQESKTEDTKTEEPV